MLTDRITIFHKLRHVAGQAGYWPRTWRLIWAAAPRRTVLWVGLLIAQGVAPVALVYLSKLVVDRLVAAFAAGGAGEGLGQTAVLIALLAGTMVLIEALQSATEWARAGQVELVHDYIKNLVHRQAAAVDYACYELPEYHDLLDQVRGEAGNRPLTLLESAGSLIQNGITLVAMAAIVLPYGVWLPLALVVSTLPALAVVLRFERRYHQWWQQTTADRRRVLYYDALLTQSASAAEVRLLDLSAHLRSAYQAVRGRLRSERSEHLRRQGLARFGAGALALLISGGALAWMVGRALQGFATLGDLVLLYQALQRGQGLMRSLLGSLGQVYASTLYLGKLFAFLELRPQVTTVPDPTPAPVALARGISFRNVTFRYPGGERPALEDFSLTIPARQVVAIVGPNGAGKSTLVKLLCRLYDPDAGRIELDGIDLRDIAVEELRRLMTVLFQFPVSYQASARENVAFGDLAARADLEEIEAAARQAGAHETIARLPRGYDTQLGTWFADGVELSGGEWQRVATARAFLRKAQVVVLDEPTSFTDSWAEADWFARLRVLVHGRTALIITHRFTIAMRADVIHVMDCGQIVESGRHHELLASGGLYARSWAAQMQAAGGEDGLLALRGLEAGAILDAGPNGHARSGAGAGTGREPLTSDRSR